MSPNQLFAAIVEKHPDIKKMSIKNLRLLKRAMKEALALSARQTLNAQETDRTFKRLIPDSGKPSAALRAYRKRLNLTQADLAKRCGIPQPHLSAMESGKRPIGLKAAKKLAIALSIDYQKLI